MEDKEKIIHSTRLITLYASKIKEKIESGKVSMTDKKETEMISSLKKIALDLEFMTKGLTGKK